MKYFTRFTFQYKNTFCIINIMLYINDKCCCITSSPREFSFSGIKLGRHASSIILQYTKEVSHTNFPFPQSLFLDLTTSDNWETFYWAFTGQYSMQGTGEKC